MSGLAGTEQLQGGNNYVIAPTVPPQIKESGIIRNIFLSELDLFRVNEKWMPLSNYHIIKEFGPCITPVFPSLLRQCCLDSN